MEQSHNGQTSSSMTEETVAFAQAYGPLIHKHTGDAPIGEEDRDEVGHDGLYWIIKTPETMRFT